jgi:hypothetical protein
MAEPFMTASVRKSFGRTVPDIFTPDRRGDVVRGHLEVYTKTCRSNETRKNGRNVTKKPKPPPREDPV